MPKLFDRATNRAMMKLGRPAKPVADTARAAWIAQRPEPGNGKRAELARTLGIAQANLNQWDQVPEKYAKAVAQFLGLEPWQLRPDIYTPPASPWAELATNKKD